MGNYNQNNECAGCGEHISSYHGKGCVYDPDFQPVTLCYECEEVINYEEDGGHIYPDGSVLCSSCESEQDNERTINDIKRELEEGRAVNL